MTCSHSITYSGLVKFHALEVMQQGAFRRTRRIPINTVHEIARDLDRLDRKHPLDETIDAVLQRAEAHAAEIARKTAP